MTASEFMSMCRYVGGLPMLIFRDHVGGRIKVYRNGEWVATLVPEGMLADTPVLLFKNESNDEFRADWGTLAHYMSVYQQSNGDLNSVYDAEDATYN